MQKNASEKPGKIRGDSGVLLTRSRENNERLKTYLASLGYHIFEEPLIEYTDFSEKISSLGGILGEYIIIITSIHAAKILAKKYQGKYLQFICVGEESARILSDAAFEVISYFPNVKELKQFIQKTNKKDFLYLRGEIVTEILPFCREEIIYKTNYKKTLSAKLQDEIKKQKIQIYTFFSYNSAKLFLELINKHNLQSFITYSEFYCFSEKIASYVQNNGYNRVKFCTEASIDNFKLLFV